MASVTVPPPVRPHVSAWFASPWLWAALGLVVQGVCILWLYAGGDTPLRIGLVWAGLLCAGVAVTIRFQTPAPAASAPAGLRLLLAGIFALLAVADTAVMIASWFGVTFMGPGIATVLWLLTAPLCASAAWQLVQRAGGGDPLGRLEEAAALLLVFALACLGAQVALLDSWYTLKNFLAVLTWVAVFAAPFTVVTSPVRRWSASALIAFHFGGIITATLTLSPNPWIFTQIWVRIYRPYLEFMYLNNAYHFYSPEPGPASHVWFRLYFEGADGVLAAKWFKIPTIDESGQPRHGTALIYQRYLSVTENTVNAGSLGVEDPAFEKRLARRRLWSPSTPKKDAVVGEESVPMEERIPFHPDLTPSQQFKLPTLDTQRLLASYARHVAHRTERDDPGMKLVKIRIYRVVHVIPPAYLYMSGWDPNDPNFFHPYYMGEYAPDGTLLNPNDPFLYWMLPVLRDPPVTYLSKIRDWARRHAGDPQWVCIIDENGQRVWTTEEARFAD